LLLLYLVDFIERNNISFAIIGGMNKDLHIGNADAGLASGIFFIGYCILQVPSGIRAERYDVRKFLLVLGSAWGVVAMATGLSQNLAELLAARFLLGSAVPVLSLALLIFGGLFFFAMHAPFWTITMEILSAALVGAGIGMISLIGNIGSFLGPYIMGDIQQATGCCRSRWRSAIRCGSRRDGCGSSSASSSNSPAVTAWSATVSAAATRSSTRC
jgi:MFS family permease